MCERDYKMAYRSVSGVFYCIVFVSVLGVFNCANGFNVDTVNYVRFRGESNSMFGFSVALHQNGEENWVLVGAPEAQSRQPGVLRGGEVFRCSSISDDRCQALPFDTKGNKYNTVGNQTDEKSGQWFGATIQSVGTDGPIVACAPRYVYFSSKSVDRRDPVGTCFVAKGDFSDYQEYSPCRTRAWGYHRQGSCQAGLGAAISKDGSRIFVGAPGSWYWQGQLYSIKPNIQLPYLPPRYSLYGEGQIFSHGVQTSASTTPNVFSTPEGPAIDDDSYLGYSVATGDFTGDGEKGVAVGMPRGGGLMGKIILFTWQLENLQNITGEQLGAYFGYAITVADVDGDDYDDLIIGAPLFTEMNNEGKYETGRVYVIYQRSDQGIFKKLHRLDGVNSRARFGLSLAYLGDMNLDNFDDFAVGAPYDGPNGNGAVYIYHGSRNGVREKYSQVIFAEDLKDGVISTFGFSLSGGVDLDQNDYPDMVVGAYESNKAMFFRSRPVVKIKANVNFIADKKQISLEQTNCTLSNGKRVPCTDIQMCMEFDGIGVDQTIEIRNEYVLDSKNLKIPRMFFLTAQGKNALNDTFIIEKGRRFCKNLPVYIKENVRDKLTPLEAEMRINMVDQSARYASQVRSGRSILFPILDHDAGLIQKDSLSIKKNCSDNICIPDLRLIAHSSVHRYLLGSKERLKIDVIIQNEGEDAFETIYTLKIPPGINFINIDRKNATQADIPIQCSAPTIVTNNTLKCDIGNPLPAGKLIQFAVLLEPFYKQGMRPNYEFVMDVNSTNPENGTTTDNHQHIIVNIWIKTDFTIEGNSKPTEIYINGTQYNTVNATHEADIGPQVIHFYNIRNNGPSNIDEAEVFFAWPMKTLAGDNLMYMLDEPETHGPIICEYVNEINEQNLILEHRKSYLELIGISTAGSQWASRSAVRNGHTGGILVEERISSGQVGSGQTPRKVEKKILTIQQKKEYDDDENIEETGDGSFRHEQRIKATIDQQQGSKDGESHRVSVIGSGESSGATSGDLSGSGVQITKTEHRYTTGWNTTSFNGSPAQTHTWSRNTTRGPDGVLRVSESSGGGIDVAGAAGAVGSDEIGGSYQYTSSRGLSGGAQGSESQSNYNESSSSEKRQWSSHSNQSRGGKWNSESGRAQDNMIGGGQSGNVRWTIEKTHTRDIGGTDAEHEQVIGTRFEGQSQGGETHITHTSSGERHHSQSSGTGRHHSQGRDHISHTDTDRSHSITSTHNQPVVTHTSREYVAGGGFGSRSSHEKDQSGRGISEGHHQETGINRHHLTRTSEGQNSGEYSGSFDTEDPQWSHEETVNTDIGGGIASGIYTERGSQTRGQSGGSQRESGLITTYASRNGSEGGEEKIYNAGRDRSTYGKYDQRNYDPSIGLGNAAIGRGLYTGSVDIGQLGPAINEHRSQGSGHTSSVDSSHAGGGRHHSKSVQYGTSYSSGERSHASRPTGYDPDLGYIHANEHKYSGGGRTQTGDSNHRETWSSEGGTNTYSSSGGSSRQYSSSSGGHHSREQDRGRDGNIERHYESHSSHHTHSETDNPQNINNQFTLYKKFKRQAIKSESDQTIEKALKCKATQCAIMRCTIGHLDKNHPDVWISFRSRVNATTIKRIGGGKAVDISSMMVARISKLPYIGKPSEQSVKGHEVFTKLIPKEADQKTEVPPLWVVVLSAIAGTIILLLLIYLLYKCGFFKRNRPSDAPERQPLNRNGHYQNGDEQL